jgi:AraC-like DNA-binding protein
MPSGIPSLFQPTFCPLGHRPRATIARSMIQAKYIPTMPLAGFVYCFWYWEGTVQKHAKERLMPTGEPTIVFDLREQAIRVYDWKDPSRFETFGHAVLCGPRSQPFVIDTAQQDRVFGIQFRPGGAFPFFRASAQDFENRDVELDLLWPGAAGEMRERLLESNSVEAMFQVAETTLMGQLARPLELHRAVACAARSFSASPHCAKVAAIVDRIGMSHRRFLQLFTDQIGMTPKAFCRVRRFQRVLHHVNAAEEIDWTQLALDCGYYDQAHFIHDFQNFSGFLPTVYNAIKTTHANHVPLV